MTNRSTRRQHDVERRSCRRRSWSPWILLSRTMLRARSTGVRAGTARRRRWRRRSPRRAPRCPARAAGPASTRALHTSPASFTRPPSIGDRRSDHRLAARRARAAFVSTERRRAAPQPLQRTGAGVTSSSTGRDRDDDRPARGTGAPSAAGDGPGQRAAGEHREDEVEREHLEDAQQRAPHRSTTASPSGPLLVGQLRRRTCVRPIPGVSCDVAPVSPGRTPPGRQRPSAWSTTSGTSNAPDRVSAVSTSSIGPAAKTLPARSSRTCVKPGGISSTWCVTSTSDRRPRVAGQLGQRRDQLLAAAEVQAGGGLVEQQQLGVGHERPGDLHALALALAEGAEVPVGQVGDAERRQQVRGARLVERLVLLAPATGDAVRRRSARRRAPARPPGSGRRARRSTGRSAAAARTRRRAPAASPAGRPCPGVGCMPAGGHLQQRGLAGAVAAEHHPALALADRPRHLVEDRRRPPADRHGLQVEHVGHGHDPNRASRTPAARADGPRSASRSRPTVVRWTCTLAPPRSPLLALCWPTTAPTASVLVGAVQPATTSRTPCSVEPAADEPPARRRDGRAARHAARRAAPARRATSRRSCRCPATRAATARRRCSSAATEAGEAVLVRTPQACLVRGARGAALRVRARARAPGDLGGLRRPDWRHAAHARTGSLQDAERELRQGLLQATEALVAARRRRGGARRGRAGRRAARRRAAAGGCPTGSTAAACACWPARPGCARSSRWPTQDDGAAVNLLAGRPALDRACATSTGWPAARWSPRRAADRRLRAAERQASAARYTSSVRSAIASHVKWSSTRSPAGAARTRARRGRVATHVGEHRGQVGDEPLGVHRRAGAVLQLVDRHQPAGDAVVDDLRDAAGGRPDDRQPARPSPRG